MRYEELQQALEVLSIKGPARHRDLLKSHHPDAGGTDVERIRQINAAYRVVMTYCRDFRFAFSQEEFWQQSPEERLRHQFADDPIWGS